jgi:hypothetical protein
MAATNAVAAPPPPFTTPLITGASVAAELQVDPSITVPDFGLVTMAWMMYFTWLGTAGIGGAPSGAMLAIVSNAVAIALVANNMRLELTLNQAAQVTISNPTGAVTWQTFTLYILTDGTTDRPSPLWDTNFGNDVQAIVLSGAANSRTIIQMTLHPDALWHIDYMLGGQVI